MYVMHEIRGVQYSLLFGTGIVYGDATEMVGQLPLDVARDYRGCVEISCCCLGDTWVSGMYSPPGCWGVRSSLASRSI